MTPLGTFICGIRLVPHKKRSCPTESSPSRRRLNAVGHEVLTQRRIRDRLPSADAPALERGHQAELRAGDLMERDGPQATAEPARVAAVGHGPAGPKRRELVLVRVALVKIVHAHTGPAHAEPDLHIAGQHVLNSAIQRATIG